jgi:O-6-methylguanine DNA methyltransferase
MDTLHRAEFDSPVGPLAVVSTEKGLVYVELPHASGRGFHGWRERHAPRSEVIDATEPNKPAIGQILEYLVGERREFQLPLDLRATPFQLAVYEQIAAIPYGESRAYREVARNAGHPTAVRAVGTATAANPLPLVVPCHRVIGSGGKLTGYTGGIDTQAKLLAMERARSKGGLLL